MFLLVTIFFAAGAFAQPEYSFSRSFGAKSGHAEYRLTGELSGTKSLWWDDWGAKYREEIDTKEIFGAGEKAVPTAGSVLAVEMKKEDALLLIIAAPAMTREKLVVVFDDLRF